MTTKLEIHAHEVDAQRCCRWRWISCDLAYGRDVIRDMLQSLCPYKTVLDLGAGHGYDLLTAKTICPSAVTVAVDYCCRTSARHLDDHKRVWLDIEREALPFESGSIDVIIINQVLEHCKEIWWILHEATRCLMVGGSLIIGVPNLASLHNRILLAIGRQPTQLKNYSAHVRGFTKSDILTLMKEACGEMFILKGFAGSQFYPFPPKLAAILSRLCPNMAFSIFLLLRKQKDYSDEFLRYPIKKQLETNFYLGPDVQVHILE